MICKEFLQTNIKKISNTIENGQNKQNSANENVLNREFQVNSQSCNDMPIRMVKTITTNDKYMCCLEFSYSAGGIVNW